MFPNNPYSQNPYQVPMYGQVQQPPMPQLSTLQQTQAMAQQPVQTNQNGSLYGRVVGNLNEIVPDDVPRDGSIGLFPQRDYSCIFAKQWNNDGSISTIKFIPEMTQPEPVQTSQFESDVMARLDSIEDMLKHQKKPYQKNNRYDQNRAKAETGESNE